MTTYINDLDGVCESISNDENLTDDEKTKAIDIISKAQNALERMN